MISACSGPCYADRRVLATRVENCAGKTAVFDTVGNDEILYPRATEQLARECR
jgi:hypothetical protein